MFIVGFIRFLQSLLTLMYAYFVVVGQLVSLFYGPITFGFHPL